MRTRAFLTALVFLAISAVQFAHAETSTACPNLTKTLRLGMRDKQVIVLKKFLTKEGYLSAAKSTDYFGPSTQEALQAWQKKKRLITSGSPTTNGFGATGPQTRLVINNCKSAAIILVKPNKVAETKSGVATQKKDEKPVTQTAKATAGGGGSAVSTVTSEPMKVALGSCQFNDQQISPGSSVIVYLSDKVPEGKTCESEVRVCKDGLLSGSFTKTSCRVGTKTSCTVADITLQNGSSATFFLDSVAPDGEKCKGEERICSQGKLSGSYTNTECAFTLRDQPCDFGGIKVASGSTVTAYEKETASDNHHCTSQVRMCNNGRLSGDYQFSKCTDGKNN